MASVLVISGSMQKRAFRRFHQFRRDGWGGGGGGGEGICCAPFF